MLQSIHFYFICPVQHVSCTEKYDLFNLLTKCISLITLDFKFDYFLIKTLFNSNVCIHSFSLYIRKSWNFMCLSGTFCVHVLYQQFLLNVGSPLPLNQQNLRILNLHVVLWGIDSKFRKIWCFWANILWNKIRQETFFCSTLYNTKCGWGLMRGHIAFIIWG